MYEEDSASAVSQNCTAEVEAGDLVVLRLHVKGGRTHDRRAIKHSLTKDLALENLSCQESIARKKVYMYVHVWALSQSLPVAEEPVKHIGIVVCLFVLSFLS